MIQSLTLRVLSDRKFDLVDTMNKVQNNRIPKTFKNKQKEEKQLVESKVLQKTRVEIKIIEISKINY